VREGAVVAREDSRIASQYSVIESYFSLLLQSMRSSQRGEDVISKRHANW